MENDRELFSAARGIMRGCLYGILMWAMLLFGLFITCTHPLETPDEQRRVIRK